MNRSKFAKGEPLPVGHKISLLTQTEKAGKLCQRAGQQLLLPIQPLRRRPGENEHRMDKLEQLTCKLKARFCDCDSTRTILITGASRYDPTFFSKLAHETAFSGIGLAAAKLFLHISPHFRLILVSRNKEKADQVYDEVSRHLPDGYNEANKIISLACDHTSIHAIHQFNKRLRQRLRRTTIDVLCLNAAFLAAKDSEPNFTEDGLEVTFQTNYMAPFILCHLLADLVSPGGRVVLTTSGLHERAELDLSGMLDSNGVPQKGFEMADGSTFHFKRSYAVSKLCVVGLCSELHQRLQSRRVVCNCFSPGLMTSSGLFRHQAGYGENPMKLVPNKEVLKKVKEVGWGAGSLVFMALAKETGETGGTFWRDPDGTMGWDAEYGVHFRATPIADKLDAETREKLWNISCTLAGIENRLMIT